MNAFRGNAGPTQEGVATADDGSRIVEPLADPLAEPSSRRNFLAVAAAIIVLFWVAQLASLTTLLLFRSPDNAMPFLVPRAMVSSLGMLISFGMLAVQSAASKASLAMRAGLAILLAVIGAALHAIANELVFSDFVGSHFTWVEFLPTSLGNLWTYLAISVIVLALMYARDLRERERRIAALRAVAHAAQLRALRFQLNPHFLFNALNSIASLIFRNRNAEAEEMTECLSDFLRSTMRMDPEGEIALGEEIALQSLYLEIEKARFPKRLVVEVDVPVDLQPARVPNLISQPLIVTVRIFAQAEDGQLVLGVADDGAATPAAGNQGTHIGLSNVAERLRLHFGDQASLIAGPLPGRGYEAVIRLPLRGTG
jgi:hypothetical protein